MFILAPSFLIESFSFLQVIRTTIKSGQSSKFGKIRSYTVGLAALERLGKSADTYNWRNLVATLTSLLLTGTSSFLQVPRTYLHA